MILKFKTVQTQRKVTIKKKRFSMAPKIKKKENGICNTYTNSSGSKYIML